MTLIAQLPPVPDKCLHLPFKPRLTKDSFDALVKCLGLPCTHIMCGSFGYKMIMKAITESNLLDYVKPPDPRSTLTPELMCNLNGVTVLSDIFPGSRVSYPYGNNITFACIKNGVVLTTLQVNWLSDV